MREIMTREKLRNLIQNYGEERQKLGLCFWNKDKDEKVYNSISNRCSEIYCEVCKAVDKLLEEEEC